jgi:hypothetical protein
VGCGRVCVSGGCACQAVVRDLVLLSIGPRVEGGREMAT